MLLNISLFLISSVYAKPDQLPLSGKNINDIRKDIGAFPMSVKLVDKKGVVRFQVVSKGGAVIAAAKGMGEASTHLIVASIGNGQWQLRTYRHLSKLVIRLLPIERKSGTMLRVWTDRKSFFDIDLNFKGKLTIEATE